MTGHTFPKTRLSWLLGVAFWIALWALVAALIHKPLVFAGPLETISALFELASKTSFWHALELTCVQILGGFFIAFVGALIFGILGDRFLFMNIILNPAMNFLKSVPVVCVIVILLLWMGSAYVAPVVVLLMVLPAYYFTIASALADKRSEESGAALTAAALRLMGVSPLTRFLSEGWAHLLPYLKATSSSVVGMAWKAGVAAQLIGLSIGTLGEQVFQAKALVEAPTLFALTISIVLSAFICEQVWLTLLGTSKFLFARLALCLPLKGAAADVFSHEGRSASASSTNSSATDFGSSFFLAEHVSVCRGDKKVLDDISLSVPPSVVVMGASGLGKTTLCETLLGLIKPDEGCVKTPTRVGVVFQMPTLIAGLTVKDNLALVAGKKAVDELFCGNKNAPGTGTRAQTFKKLLGGIKGSQKAEELSGGQSRRVELVRALLAPAVALLLDEPFSGLDEQSKQTARELLAESLRSTKKPLLLVSHDKGDAQSLGLSVFNL